MWILEENASPGTDHVSQFSTREEALSSVKDEEIRAGLDSEGYYDATPETSTGNWSFKLYEQA
jgi:hypothetical protein